MALDRTDTLLAAGAAVVAGLALGAVLLPDLVYDGFLWKYFWGPIVADAANQATAVHDGIVAHRGYTPVNEVGYALVLGYAVLLLVRVLDRAGLGRDRGFVVAFLPFIVGGGLLRVVEDAGMLSVPVRYLVISPVIYLTMFAVVLAAVGGAVALSRRGAVDDPHRVIAAAGGMFAAGVAAVLFLSQPLVHGWMLPATLGLAAVAFLPVYAAAGAFAGDLPGLVRLRTAEGATIMAGHLVDGASTALSLDLLGYGEKHPVAATVVELAGTPYSFLVLKVAVIGAILYAMTDAVRDDDPVFSNLVLLAVLAVGLGPGTRNLARAMLGV